MRASLPCNRETTNSSRLFALRSHERNHFFRRFFGSAAYNPQSNWTSIWLCTSDCARNSSSAVGGASSSMISVLRVLSASHTIAGRGRASSPVPEGAIFPLLKRSCHRAIAPACARLGRSTRDFARTFSGPVAEAPGEQPVAAGTHLNGCPTAAFIFVGRAGRPGFAAAWPGARSNLALARGAGK